MVNEPAGMAIAAECTFENHSIIMDGIGEEGIVWSKPLTGADSLFRQGSHFVDLRDCGRASTA